MNVTSNLTETWTLADDNLTGTTVDPITSITESWLSTNQTSIDTLTSTAILPTSQSVYVASVNSTNGPRTCVPNKQCPASLIIPFWLPQVEDTPDPTATIIYRAVVYIIALAYLLFGVSIVTDRIITASEVIISQKRDVKVKLKSGEAKTVKVLVWHPIVGSCLFSTPATSSQSILLPIIGIFKSGFQGGELGPSLIIGTGAYQLFMITAICILSTRDTAPKPIKNLHIFFPAAFYGIIAYIWIYLLLDVISPGVVELWEAIITLSIYPSFVLMSWLVAKRYPQMLFRRCIRAFRFGSVAPTDQELEDDVPFTIDADSPEQEQRRKLASILQKLKKEHPNKSLEELESMASEMMEAEIPKSEAYYRLQGSKAVVGVSSMLPHADSAKEFSSRKTKTFLSAKTSQTVGFLSTQSSCFESCGTTVIIVERHGTGIGDKMLLVDYETVEGTAKGNANFVPISAGKLRFGPSQTRAEIFVKILNDDIFEATAKHFKVKLSNPFIVGGQGANRVDLSNEETTVYIMDDDHCGVFMFEKSEMVVPDNIDNAHIKVIRSIGTRGSINVPYRILPGTAKQNEDYVALAKNALIFENGQFEASIEIKIIDKDRHGEVYTFYIELLPPRKASADIKSTIGDPKIGERKIVQIGICEDEELKEALNRILEKTDLASQILSATWKESIISACQVFPGDSGVGVPWYSKLLAYIIHLLAFPWKFTVAILPPPGLMRGYIAYASLIGLMVLIAALVGDCASYLGCTIGLKDTITAITLISAALGLPGTFSSRRAAINEKTADAAIGSITRSNASTKFLGIGIAWTIGASYRLSIGDERGFRVSQTDLGFTIMLYCTFSSVVTVVLLLRRLPPIRGELGGPAWARYLTGGLFITLWIMFILFSLLESYCIIRGLK